MSLKAMTWATEMRGLSPAQFRVLLVLAHHHNHKTGDCFPSQECLSEECEISVRSVHAHLKTLEDMGLIARERRVGAEGQCIGTNYTLALQNNQAENIAGWTDDGDVIPVQPENSGTSNRQLISGDNEPGKEPIPPLSPREEIGYGRPKRQALSVVPHPSPSSGGASKWPGDPNIRNRLVASEGEGFAISYLDRSTVGPNGEIVAWTSHALTKLKGCRALNGIRILDRAEANLVPIVPAPDGADVYARQAGGS